MPRGANRSASSDTCELYGATMRMSLTSSACATPSRLIQCAVGPARIELTIFDRVLLLRSLVSLVDDGHDPQPRSFEWRGAYKNLPVEAAERTQVACMNTSDVNSQIFGASRQVSGRNMPRSDGIVL